MRHKGIAGGQVILAIGGDQACERLAALLRLCAPPAVLPPHALSPQPQMAQAEAKRAGRSTAAVRQRIPQAEEGLSASSQVVTL